MRWTASLLPLFAAPLLLLAGCAREITVTRVGAEGRLHYGSAVTGSGLSANSVNLLANLLLADQYE